MLLVSTVVMREDNDQNAAPQPRESDPIKLNVFGRNQSVLYQAVSEADTSNMRESEGKTQKHFFYFYLVSLRLKVYYWESTDVRGEKPKYEEYSCKLKRKFAPFEGFSYSHS